MHLLMDLTEVLVVLGRLKAFGVLTSKNLALLWHILSKVEAFGWEHF